VDADFVQKYFPNPASYQEFVMDDLFAVYHP
jgi:hypothetical protein